MGTYHLCQRGRASLKERLYILDFFITVPIIELFKWEVSYLLPDYYEWTECANLLDISRMAQRDISECCFSHRRYYETVDAFECDVSPCTPESLLEKLQNKFPELKEKFASCLRLAQSFQLPSLGKCCNLSCKIYTVSVCWFDQELLL